MTPAAWKVSTTGSPVSTTSARSAAQLSGSAARVPTSRTGLAAPRMRSAARQIVSTGAEPSGGTGRGRVIPAAVGAASTSDGRITAADPRGSVVAARNALTTVSGTLSGSLTSPVNLV